MIRCSRCLTSKVIKYGCTHYGKRRYSCKLCHKQFVADSTHYISEEKRQAIARCLRERLSLRAISRVFEVSLTWLLGFARHCYKQVPQDLGTSQFLDKEKLRWSLASIQLDEMYSFVGNKKAKQWIFLAYQADSRQAVAVQIGKRNLTTLKKLWRQIPKYLRQHSGRAGWISILTVIRPTLPSFRKTNTSLIKPIPKALRRSMAASGVASVDWYAEPDRSLKA